MMAFNNLLQKIHVRLLPADSEQGVLPYVWLVYLFIYLIPIFINPVETWVMTATFISAAVFLILYFFTFWQSGIAAYVCIASMLTLGLVSASFNPGASVFFVYSAAFCVQIQPQKRALQTVFAIAGVAALYSYLFEMPAYFYLPAVIISILIGMVNIYEAEIKSKNKQLKVSQEELRKAATTAERERIARDLHDVIGHTFSLINVKAQLAQKLLSKDAEKALQEIKELEQISRSAMAEVRQTVSSYHEKDMASEISKAKILAQSADISLDCAIDELPETSQLNSTLAFVIRELMTNMVKHSSADKCQLHYSCSDDLHQLTIADNGKMEHSQIQEGNGLRGIRERIEALNGTVSVSAAKGFELSIRVPVNG